MSVKIELNSIPTDIDNRLKQLIGCFESAIRYCEEVRGGTLEQDGNLNYLIHDWGRRENHHHNEELKNWFDELAEFYNDKFANKDGFIAL